ncbi:hypothetical protein [Fredinandcohnia sp. 179-A 10B2 NHS]|uniref:hypothetical protein n=1 Tax=Fredinandcohnia sp. 179-A 10B2 NHS TaxID=3235176 RepID=UPI0039A28034
MKHSFVMLRTGVMEVVCPCTHCEGMKKIEVRKGTIITITPDKKYVDGLGWYFLIDFNWEYQVYINIHDFEHYYFQEIFCSLVDFDLKYIYIQFRLNQALDERNKEAFNYFSDELIQLNKLKETIVKRMQYHDKV